MLTAYKSGGKKQESTEEEWQEPTSYEYEKKSLFSLLVLSVTDYMRNKALDNRFPDRDGMIDFWLIH